MTVIDVRRFSTLKMRSRWWLKLLLDLSFCYLLILFPMTRNDKTEIIKSVLIIRPDEDFPRLVTCYINE